MIFSRPAVIKSFSITSITCIVITFKLFAVPFLLLRPSSPALTGPVVNRGLT